MNGRGLSDSDKEKETDALLTDEDKRIESAEDEWIYLQQSREEQSPDAVQPKKDLHPHLNVGQRIAGGTVNFLETLSALVWGTAIAMDEGLPTISVPGNYAVPALASIGVKEALHSLRVLSQREHPLDALFLEGSGNFAVGLAKEGGKMVAAAIPPVMFALGASYGRDALYNYAMSAPEDHINLMLALSYFDTPLLRSLLITVPSLLMYAAGKKAIEKFVPGMQPAEIPPQDNPDLHWYQHVLGDGLTVANSMMVAGLVRQIFSTIVAEFVLHSPYIMLAAPAAALTLYLLHHVAEELHPINNAADILPEAGKPPVSVLDDANAPEPQAEQSKARIAANIALKVAIALGAFTLTALVNRYASAAISNGHPELTENDPSGWTTAERVLYEGGLTAFMIFVMRVVENSPKAIQKMKEDGPAVVGHIKERAPQVAATVKSGVVHAAQTIAHGATQAAHAIGEYCKPSVSGFFAGGRPPPPSTSPVVSKRRVSIDDGELDFDFSPEAEKKKALPVINVDETDFDFDVSGEDVAQGYTI